MNVDDLYRIFASRFRPRRMKRFCDVFQVTNETTIIDLGGSAFNWTLIAPKPRVTVVNLDGPPANVPPNIEWVVGDVLDLSYPDNSFDIAYSNSLIEHLGTEERQSAFARQVRRLAKRYYVQTPNVGFPIEPHYLAPFIHWLPVSIRRHLIRYCTPWGLTRKPNRAGLDRIISELRLLSRRDLQRLFHDATIEPERVAGLVKSWIAMQPGG